jgi:hypothetical protein
VASRALLIEDLVVSENSDVLEVSPKSARVAVKGLELEVRSTFVFSTATASSSTSRRKMAYECT